MTEICRVCLPQQVYTNLERHFTNQVKAWLGAMHQQAKVFAQRAFQADSLEILSEGCVSGGG